MRRRGCLWYFGILVVLLILCCVVGWFVGMPRFKDAIENSMSKAVATEMATQVGDVPTSEREVRFDLTDLENKLQDENSDSNVTVDGMHVTTEGNQIVVSFKAGNDEASYSFTPSVDENGHLRIDSGTTNAGWIKWLLDPKVVANSLTGGVNDYLDSNNLRLVDVRVDGTDLVLTIAPK